MRKRGPVSFKYLPSAAHKRALKAFEAKYGATPELKSGKPSKFKNEIAMVNDIKFHSRREADRWLVLKLLEKGGYISDLKRQVKYDLIVNDMKIAAYWADFTYTEDDAFVAEDSKGVKTPDYKLKKKLMLALHGIEIKET